VLDTGSGKPLAVSLAVVPAANTDTGSSDRTMAKLRTSARSRFVPCFMFVSFLYHLFFAGECWGEIFGLAHLLSSPFVSKGRKFKKVYLFKSLSKMRLYCDSTIKTGIFQYNFSKLQKSYFNSFILSRFFENLCLLQKGMPF
jgi:hypothetical protein